MKHEPLKLESEMFDKRIDITDAKCEFCKNEVRPEIMITRMYTSSKKYMDNGNFVTYWHCDNCGAVSAIVNGEVIDDPLDLMDIPAIRLNRKIFVSLRYLKSAVQELVKELKEKQAHARVYQSDETLEFYEGYEEGISDAIELIKKCFADVMEGEK